MPVCLSRITNTKGLSARKVGVKGESIGADAGTIMITARGGRRLGALLVHLDEGACESPWPM